MSKKYKKRKNRNRNKVARQVNPRREDLHHMLWQRRHWQNGYAHALREHWWFKIMLPQATIHRELHSKIHDIPTPNGKDCKYAYEQLIQMEKTTPEIMEKMLPHKRLLWLIAVLPDSCEATKAMLKWESEFLEKRGY